MTLTVTELGHDSQCLKPFGNPILNKLIKIVKLIVEVEKGDVSNVVHQEGGSKRSRNLPAPQNSNNFPTCLWKIFSADIAD